MKINKCLAFSFSLLALIVAITTTAMATDFSFTGGFQKDDDVQIFNFNVGALSSVTLRTWSYAGGTNAAGTVIPRGGFDPILAVFNSLGVRIGQNDDGGAAYVPADSVTGRYYDTYLNVSLNPGSYRVSVMQYNNFSGVNLSDGFVRDGQPNFTLSLPNTPVGSTGFFWDATGNQRDGHWAFDILNVQGADIGTVPEPSTFLLVAAGLAGAALLRRKVRK